MRNRFETSIHKQLKRHRAVFSYETEKIPYVLAKHYIPDFILQTKLGKIYIECKGHFRVTDKAKMKACKKQHPELDIRMVFYEHKEDNIRWCNKNGFKWAVGKIPTEWFKGL